MSDHIQSLSTFQRFMKVMNMFFSGYYELGAIEIGPMGSTYSFNEIEGFRLGTGLRTTRKFSMHWELKANAHYGFRDGGWKYYGHVKYYWDRKKFNYITLSMQREYYFPGEAVDFVKADNFFFSFKRGVQDKMIDFTSLNIEFSHEFSNLYQVVFNGYVKKQSPLGTLQFIRNAEDGPVGINEFRTFEVSVRQRFSPNQKYYTGRYVRTRIMTYHPVYEITYAYGQSIDQNLKFNYNRLNIRFFKRSSAGKLGYFDLMLEAEKTFGSGIPYPYMRIHAANQTYTYQWYAANFMNYLEFVSDQYAYLIYTHYFDGLFLNMIPLMKRLKWRSLISARVLYGNITDANNPEVTQGLVAFPTDKNGETITYSLENMPYIEGSIGIENIFNFIRVDIVKRFTYLDHPNLPGLGGVKGLGIRFKFRVNF